MPEPVGRGQRYMPGLDGLRALAVSAVILYHLDVPWAPGGLLGVGVFFTLSGYLITDLLLGSWEAHGSLRLRDFWLRRARRLLPALFVMLAAVSIWVALADRSQLASLRGDVAAAAVYGSNWWLAFQHVSYFARFGPPSPLGHLWSLAVEEQFYLVWPWLVWLGLIWYGRRYKRDQARRGRPGSVRNLWPLAALTLVLSALSAIEMAVLYHPSFDPSRIYDGTDTRAFGLLIGAALAMVWPSKGLRTNVGIGARRFIDGIGIVGLVVILLLIWLTNEYSPFLYRGGLVLLSVATALVVASVAHPAGRFGRALGIRPLRWTGVRSYGIYLWHYPVIVLTTATVAARTDYPRAVLQVGATVVIADLSWRLIETPIRQGATGRYLAEIRQRQWRFGSFPRTTRLALYSVPAVVLVACLGLAGLIPTVPSGTLAVASAPPTQFVTPTTALVGTSTPTTAAGSKPLGSSTTVPRTSPGQVTTGPAGAHGSPTTTGIAGPGTVTSATSPGTGTGTSTTVAPSDGLRTSCRQVAHLGDSTSESLVSPTYLPDPGQRLGAEYAKVGIHESIMEIVGANSIVETLPGDENGYEIAQGLVSQGYRGCWVIALGTNDTADVYVGSNVSLPQRIERMMALIGNEPVMWVNVKSLLTSGPYSETDMQEWDDALLAACPSHPNMRIFNWAAIAQPAWFTSDGIHYTSTGSAARAAAIADALAAAFPATTAGSAGASSSSSSSSSSATTATTVTSSSSTTIGGSSPGSSGNCMVNASPSWNLPAFQA